MTWRLLLRSRNKREKLSKQKMVSFNKNKMQNVTGLVFNDKCWGCERRVNGPEKINSSTHVCTRMHRCCDLRSSGGFQPSKNASQNILPMIISASSVFVQAVINAMTHGLRIQKFYLRRFVPHFKWKIMQSIASTGKRKSTTKSKGRKKEKEWERRGLEIKRGKWYHEKLIVM